jgi:predicted  nucleic acid-binding Zn-ribbon protein
MESPLKAVTELHAVLSELSEREAQLQGIPDWMRELHDEHSERQTEIGVIEGELEEATSNRRGAEADIADHQDKLKTLQEQISKVRNEREYGALLQEIDTIKNQISEAEEQAIAALELQEDGQGRLEAARDASKEIDERYAEALEKWEAQKPEIAHQAEGLRSRVAELEARVPENILSLFRRIMKRHAGVALAPIRRVDRAGKGPRLWHCGACNYRVRPQAVVEITDRGGIVFCDSCKRILFIEDESS